MHCPACRYENPVESSSCEFCGCALDVAVAPRAVASPAPSPVPALRAPSAPRPGARLRGVLVEAGALPGDERLHPVREGRSAIGGASDCAVHLDAPGVEDHHAWLFVTPDHARWLDVSAEGSDLNGRLVRAEPAELSDGDLIRVGATRLVFLRVPDAIFGDRE